MTKIGEPMTRFIGVYSGRVGSCARNRIVISSAVDCRLGFAASQKEKTMKMLLIMAAAIGLSAPMAFADCAYHAKNNAAVDKKMTTATVTTDNQTKSDELVLLKKTDRVSEDEEPAE